MAKLLALVSILLLASGCRRSPTEELARLSEQFVNTTLSFSPTAATAAGLHTYRKQNLDDMLDDMSPASLDRELRYYQDFGRRLDKLSAAGLTPEDRADVVLLRDECSLQVLDLSQIQSATHNPMMYAEIVGQGLFTPLVLEYAPLPDRIRHIMARLRQVPLFLNLAATNLSIAPPVWTSLAGEETQANIAMVDKTIRDAVPGDLRDAYSHAAQPAVDAMRQYQDFLKNSLSQRTGADWRLGDRYSLKFRLTTHGSREADNVLADATRDLASERAQMMALALPLHAKMAPSHHDHTDLSGDARQNQVIGEVLAHIAERHSTRESYIDDARRDLAEARAFVQEKHLLTLPAHANLQVVPTPEFERSVYTAGGFDPAPPLEPQLGAFYWVTPISPDWTVEQAGSKLREYNEYMLRLLTLHEAVPGHYVQFEIAAGMQPAARRVLRALYGSGPYVEGWAQYGEQMMLEQGFLNHSPELELTFAKQQLRVIANAILDIRLQMLNMTDQEALDFLEKQAFQEHQEAVEKLQRAKATSAQLPTYYVGWTQWNQLRDRIKKANGASFNLADFHDRALKEGAVPLEALEQLILQAPRQP
jgi:uncharacterized protein (DUF885 family)